MDEQIQFIDSRKNESKRVGRKALIAVVILILLLTFIFIGYKAYSDIKTQREKVATFVDQENKKNDMFIKDYHLDLPQGQVSTKGIDENSPEFIVKSIDNKYFAYVQKIDNMSSIIDCVEWKRPGGTVFGLKGYYAQIMGDPSKDSGTSDKIQQYFIESGFMKNAVNSYESQNKQVVGHGKTVGFEKENLKCLFSWSTNEFAKEMFVISCGKSTDESENNFKTFYGLLNNSADFCVKNNNGQFASGRVNSNPNENWMNEMWYAKKINDAWSIVWRGNAFHLPCSSVSDFPKDFYDRCEK